MTKKKICMVTTSNLDYDTRILNEAEALTQNFDVEIITAGFHQENYRKKWHFLAKPVKIFSFRPQLLARILNLWPIMMAAYYAQADIYHAHDLPGLLCTWPAAVFKRKFLVYDSHELWSSITLYGAGRIFRLPFAILEKILILRVQAIITVNNSIAEILKKKFKKSTIAIYNYPVFSKVKSKYGYRPKKIKTVLYAGLLAGGRGLFQAIETATFLDDSYKFIFIGYGDKKAELEKKIGEKNLSDRFTILNALAVEELCELISTVDIGLCLIENVSQSYYYSSPNKLFQYIASGVPVLASDFPEYKNIVMKNKIGEVVNPAEPKKIAQKIKNMTKAENEKKYRKNLRGLSSKKFNWTLESVKLVEFYKEISAGVKTDAKR